MPSGAHLIQPPPEARSPARTRTALASSVSRRDAKLCCGKRQSLARAHRSKSGHFYLLLTGDSQPWFGGLPLPTAGRRAGGGRLHASVRGPDRGAVPENTLRRRCEAGRAVLAQGRRDRTAHDLDALVAKVPGKRTARAWLYREQLREILQRKQVNVVRGMLRQWRINVNREVVLFRETVRGLG